jgi:recombinational DNA repair protein (RecF pathway)
MGHSGCKKCADELGGKKRRLDKNPTRAGKTISFEEVLAVMHSANLDPLEPYQTSTAPWKCKCLRCGEIVTPSYGHIKQGSGGCKKCYLESKIGIGRLDDDAAVLVMKGKNLIPLVPYPGAMVPWKCQCLDCGNLVKPRYAHIQQGRKGCKVCGYKKTADSLRNSQEETFRIARAAGFEPLEPYKGRHRPWLCRCLKCGEKISPHYSGIVSGGGCRYCAGLVVDPDEAIKVMKKARIQNLAPYPGAGVPWLSQCLKCGKEIKPRYSSVNRGIGGCKYCAARGYDFSKSGILYLITNKELNAHKIGITNEDSKEKRISKHLKEGWNVYQTRHFLDGNTAFEVEQEILLWWRIELALPVYLSKFEMPQGGFTETVDAAEIDLLTIWTKVQEASKNAQKSQSRTRARKTTMPTKKKVK